MSNLKKTATKLIVIGTKINDKKKKEIWEYRK